VAQFIVSDKDTFDIVTESICFDNFYPIIGQIDFLNFAVKKSSLLNVFYFVVNSSNILDSAHPEILQNWFS
jgi:hypothetical protein